MYKFDIKSVVLPGIFTVGFATYERKLVCILVERSEDKCTYSYILCILKHRKDNRNLSFKSDEDERKAVKKTPNPPSTYIDGCTR